MNDEAPDLLSEATPHTRGTPVASNVGEYANLYAVTDDDEYDDALMEFTDTSQSEYDTMPYDDTQNLQPVTDAEGVPYAYEPESYTGNEQTDVPDWMRSDDPQFEYLPPNVASPNAMQYDDLLYNNALDSVPEDREGFAPISHPSDGVYQDTYPSHQVERTHVDSSALQHVPSQDPNKFEPSPSFYEGSSLADHPSSYQSSLSRKPRVYAAPHVYAAPTMRKAPPLVLTEAGEPPMERQPEPTDDTEREERVVVAPSPPPAEPSNKPFMLTEHGEPPAVDGEDDGYLGGHYDAMEDDEIENRAAPVYVDHGDAVGVFKPDEPESDDEMQPLDDTKKKARQRSLAKNRRRRLLLREETFKWLREEEDEKNRRPCWCLKMCCCCLLLFVLFLMFLTFQEREVEKPPPDLSPDDDTTDDDFQVNRPFEGVITTPFDPYEANDCDFSDNFFPNLINQCQCFVNVTVIRNDTLTLYWQVRELINDEIYDGSYNLPYNSCDPKNQAMLWLSSGDTRDGGDLYQRYVLALIYLQLNGTHWDAGNLWMSDENECLWFGIQCNGNQKVNNFALDTNNLMGSMPSELAHMDGLVSIGFSRNHVTGTIPTHIFNMTDLQLLDIYANNLRGSLPTEIAQMTNLKELRVETNLFFGKLVTEIGNLTNLEMLSLAFNEFWMHIPTEIGLLTNLRYLDMEHNRFSGTLPSEFSRLTNLEYLMMTNNLLTGGLPQDFENLSALYELRIAHTGLGGQFPTELITMSNLYRLELGANNFKGTIPPQFGLLTAVSWFSIRENDFTGTIPTQLGNLGNLTRLILSDCLLTGTIPSEIGKLTKLKNFMLDKNTLIGTTPQEVCDLRDVNGGLLEIFVTDCPDGPGVGVDCPRPSCCSFCRRSSAGDGSDPFG